MKTFLKKFIKSPRTVGSFVPSSPKLIGSMLKNIDFREDLLIVEFGAGTGIITKQILKKASANSIVLVFEIHQEFVDELNKIKDPRIKVIHDGAQNISSYLEGKKVDIIISGLPFGSLPKKLGKSILDESHKNLKLNGKFVQFQYFLQNKKDIFNTFKNHKISLQLLNFPPAFIYKCEKIHD